MHWCSGRKARLSLRSHIAIEDLPAVEQRLLAGWDAGKSAVQHLEACNKRGVSG